VERETIFLLFLIVSAAAIGFGLAAARLRQPVVVGFLIAGLAAGRIVDRWSVDTEIIEAFADFGVTFLMFALGVQFSFRELVEMRRLVVRAGFPQILLTVLTAFVIYVATGLPLATCFVLAFASAMSSSIVALTLMELRGTLAQPAARPTVAIALSQDVAVVPLVALLPALTGSSIAEVGRGLLVAVANALIALIVITILGVRVVPWLLFHVARLGSRELFLLTVVLLAFGTAIGSERLGLSLALGAFLAGVVISESEFSYQALGGILPLRDVFGVMFFAGLGLLTDLGGLLDAWPLTLTILLTVTVLKTTITAVVVRFVGFPADVAVRSGIFLGQIGEFSFVLGLVALRGGVIDDTVYNALIGAAIASLLLNSLLLSASRPLGRLLAAPLERLGTTPRMEDEREGSQPQSAKLRGHVVIAGYGRAGREVGRVLQRRRFRFVVIDRDPVLVRELRHEGVTVVYGDVANEQVLLAAGIPTARVFVVAVPDAFAAETAVRLARALNPTLDIIARADRRSFVARLIDAGASEVVHPSFEAGLELVRHTLHRFGMSLQEIQAILTARRVDYYEEQRRIAD